MAASLQPLDASRTPAAGSEAKAATLRNVIKATVRIISVSYSCILLGRAFPCGEISPVGETVFEWMLNRPALSTIRRTGAVEWFNSRYAALSAIVRR
jgi:hypothetical protein